MFLAVSSASSGFNSSLPPLKGGILRVTPDGKTSAMSNPLSAMLSPGSSFLSKPENFVNSLSEKGPVQRDETKVTIPLEEIPTIAF